MDLLGWEQFQQLQKSYPSHWTNPAGNALRIDWSLDVPEVSGILQDFYGVSEHPCVGGIPLRIQLLSPARRPLQITQDLPYFWSNAYLEVRKEMRGRYPKHYWPEDPLEAQAGHRIKSRPPQK